MNPKKLEEIIKACLNFIYTGENERLLRALNFRHLKFGGLGLVELSMKAIALLLKNMLKKSDNNEDIQKKYGYDKKMDNHLNLFDRE